MSQHTFLQQWLFCHNVIILVSIKIFSKNLKSTELKVVKSIGTNWMELLNRCKKHRDKPVQLTITSIIISHTHAPLQLYFHSKSHQLAMHMTLMVIITIYGATIQMWCMVWSKIILDVYRFVPVLKLFTPVLQFHPTCLCTFLHLFNSVLKISCIIIIGTLLLVLLLSGEN